VELDLASPREALALELPITEQVVEGGAVGLVVQDAVGGRGLTGEHARRDGKREEGKGAQPRAGVEGDLLGSWARVP
jgi:hypothetical protein